MSITFKDVAKLAGVSTQTVSRVTNGSPHVSAETRIKVNKAIKELGYIPNKSAQMLSRTQSKIIGIVSLDITLHGVAITTNGIRKTAQQLGYATAFSLLESINIANLQKSIHELLSQKIDGIVINIPLDAEQAEFIQSQYPSIPLIFIEVSPEAEVNAIYNENALGAQLAAEHLLQLGRRHFVLITGSNTSIASRLRAESWKKCIDNTSAQIVDCYEGDWQTASGYFAIKRLIASKKQFDAILVGNDQMALGALCALHEAGISIPQNVSIVGFDDTEDAAYFTPPLTTIRQNFVELGNMAVIELVKLIEKQSAAKSEKNDVNSKNSSCDRTILLTKEHILFEPVKKVISVELVLRESTQSIDKISIEKDRLLSHIAELQKWVITLAE